MSASPYTLRAATLDDVGGVAGLMREARDFKVRSEAGWRWLFLRNPAHADRESPPVMGWVLERGGELHGYLGNVHLNYLLGGKPLRAATCSSYYVRPAARVESTRLMSAFFRQPGVDVFLTTTANASSEPVYRLFKAAVPEDPSFAEGFVWVANDRLALRDALGRRGMAPVPCDILSTIGGPAIRLLRHVTGVANAPRTESDGGDVLVFRPDELDARFDSLGISLAARPGLQVKRDAASLRWYFSDPDAGSVPLLFAVEDAEGLVGYAAVALHRPSAAATTQLRILDFVMRIESLSAVAKLVGRIVEHARENGAGLVYCAPCGAWLAAQLKALRPYRYRHSYAAHFLRAARATLTGNLARSGVWHATALDGDMPFCIERRA